MTFKWMIPSQSFILFLSLVPVLVTMCVLFFPLAIATEMDTTTISEGNHLSQILITTLYVDNGCIGENYTIYATPIDECYSGKDSYNFDTDLSLFMSHNNPFGDNDITDEMIQENDEIIGISRSFYKSTNGTCTGGITDSFPNIPLNVCVGPFGEPYPWGTLKLISKTKNVATMS